MYTPDTYSKYPQLYINILVQSCDALVRPDTGANDALPLKSKYSSTKTRKQVRA